DAHADGGRFGGPWGGGRGRPVRGGGGLAGRRGDVVRGDPAGRRDGLDDDQRTRAVVVRVLPRRGRAPGERLVGARRDAPDRHLQGVHGAEGVAVPAPPAPAGDRRAHGVLRRACSIVSPPPGLLLLHTAGRLACRLGPRYYATRT